MSGSPSAVVVENGNLYVFHQGSNEDGQLWYTYYDGANWAPDTPVRNLGMSSSPSAVAWAGGISVFHQGSDNNGQLWYTYSRDGLNSDTDTPVPNVNMSGSPSAVVYNGLLYVFYQGGQRLRRTALARGLRWHKLGPKYRLQRRYVGLTLGSSLGRWYDCLPPGVRPRRAALVLVFQWYKLGHRYASSERRYFGLTELCSCVILPAQNPAYALRPPSCLVRRNPPGRPPSA
jgi:hypothetical protein